MNGVVQGGAEKSRRPPTRNDLTAQFPSQGLYTWHKLIDSRRKLLELLPVGGCLRNSVYMEEASWWQWHIHIERRPSTAIRLEGRQSQPFLSSRGHSCMLGWLSYSPLTCRDYINAAKVMEGHQNSTIWSLYAKVDKSVWETGGLLFSLSLSLTLDIFRTDPPSMSSWECKGDCWMPLAALGPASKSTKEFSVRKWRKTCCQKVFFKYECHYIPSLHARVEPCNVVWVWEYQNAAASTSTPSSSLSRQSSVLVLSVQWCTCQSAWPLFLIT